MQMENIDKTSKKCTGNEVQANERETDKLPDKDRFLITCLVVIYFVASLIFFTCSVIAFC